ncbi:MAG: DUF3786 domain-containing protein [Thermodesulfobacteriota bacterium]
MKFCEDNAIDQTKYLLLCSKPRLCSSHLLRPEKPCCPALAGFHDFASRYIYKYAFGAKSLQLLVSLRSFNPRDDAHGIIWVKNESKMDRENNKPKLKTSEELYGPAITKAVEELQNLDPRQVALKSGAEYLETVSTMGQIKLAFFGQDYLIHVPQCTVEKVDTKQAADKDQEIIVITRILLLHYLLNADGTPLAQSWATLSQFPGGQSYESVLKIRGSQPLDQAFATNVDAFIAAAEAMGGERLSLGDASFSFDILPRLRLAPVLYVADEEFPSSVDILFDAAAGNYLPTYDLTIVAAILAEKLTKKRGNWRDTPY